ncbi:MAG: hypothetical protein OH337_04105 [Candidatus Parvarchaeota archaeon]|nr:hypothetical protein [Candidatus Haiyanarchaeum thermophilum]
MKKIDKPWGHEEVLLEDYCLVKRLVLHDETSTHYHVQRNEVLIPVSGSGVIVLGNNTVSLQPLVPVFVPVGTVHRIVPHTSLVIIEVSDKNIDDVVRVSDKHHRV